MRGARGTRTEDKEIQGREEKREKGINNRDLADYIRVVHASRGQDSDIDIIVQGENAK